MELIVLAIDNDSITHSPFMDRGLGDWRSHPTHLIRTRTALRAFFTHTTAIHAKMLRVSLDHDGVMVLIAKAAEENTMIKDSKRSRAGSRECGGIDFFGVHGLSAAPIRPAWRPIAASLCARPAVCTHTRGKKQQIKMIRWKK